jgi:hypothetical protein
LNSCIGHDFVDIKGLKIFDLKIGQDFIGIKGLMKRTLNFEDITRFKTLKFI